MRNLTYQELLKAPGEIQYLYVSYLNKRAVGKSFHDEAMAKHPEYFQDEIEYLMKWEKIPTEVKEACNKEMAEMRASLTPPSQGLRHYLANQAEIDKQFDAIIPEIRKREKEIFNRHYGPFGLKRE